MSLLTKAEAKEETESQLIRFEAPLRLGSIAGTQAVPKGYRSQTFAPDRFCQNPECSIRLNTYNKGPNCYSHSPYRYPRVRGRKPTATTT